MLFNSFEFIFFFLPLTWLGYYALRRHAGTRLPIAWLTLASLLYYGWWDPRYLVLLIGSDVVNYLIGRKLLATERNRSAKLLLTAAIIANLIPLAWFKYANFLLGNVNALFHTQLPALQLVLPLAISFYTFQKIAYLVDAYQKKVPAHGFLDFILFVSFFPQLIAGPIVHHSEIMPQFKNLQTSREWRDNVGAGATLFTIGLFKKVVLADTLALFVNPAFDAAAQGGGLTSLDAWTGALAYTFQIYFDFSGYSDMALGAALLFGIRLPINFYSPYRAWNIIEFWRRWHMTLSRFLRDYVYIPLGGNRLGQRRRYANLMITMALGGIWHGAGWNFLLWGLLHGGYLAVNHGWQHLADRHARPVLQHAANRLWSWPLTLLAVIVAWVYFRAPSIDAAHAILHRMFEFTGGGYSAEYLSAAETSMLYRFATLAWGGFSTAWAAPITVLIAAGIAFCLPNSMQIMRAIFEPPAAMATAGHSTWQRCLWRPNYSWALITAALGSLSLLSFSVASEFIYFQF